MLDIKNQSVKNQIVISGFLPVILCGDIYIYLYSIFAIFFLDKEVKKGINKYKLIIYSIGLLSFIINQDIKILISITIIFIYDEILLIKSNNIVRHVYYFICFIVLVVFINNYDEKVRIEFLNNNVFNAVLFIYISIFALTIRQSYIAFPFVLMFITRTAVIGWIVWYLTLFLKQRNNKKINFYMLLLGVIIFFSISYFPKIDINSLPYLYGIDRIFVINDSSMGSRINQYIVFVENLDLVQILTSSKDAFLITSDSIMVPHSTIATLLERGGIFYLIFVYSIAAYRVRSSVFLPIFFCSLVLHSAFIAHVLILIEKFKEAQDRQ